ncbi:MAG: hypothetical protein H7069_10975 [Phormidesmis sp. FL-bin-119]|nr:hypothetical protein [Pedobacter sp.]
MKPGIASNFLFFAVIVVLSSCHKEIQSQTEVYTNNFEGASLAGIQGGIESVYDSKKVLGFYNNSGFTLTLSGLAKHDLLLVKFDLYLHDSWGGNNTGTIDVVDGPDVWQLKINNETLINTTFSNSGCFPTYCQQQSYPKNFPFHHDAGTGASRTDLPGRCSLANVPGGTTMYRIEKIFNNSSSNLVLEFKDLLKQNNAVNMLCDESWSLDNLSVSILTLD